MSQTTISQYFSNRKRSAVDEIKSLNQDKKLLIPCDIISTDVSSFASPCEERLILKRKISWDCDDEVPKKKVVTTPNHNPKGTPKFTTIRTSIKKSRVKTVEKSATRKNLFSNHILEKKETILDKQIDLNPVDSPTDPTPLESSPSPPDIPIPDDLKLSSSSKTILTKDVTPSEFIQLSGEQLSRSDQVELASCPIKEDSKNKLLKVSEENVKPIQEIQVKPSTSKKSLREELGLSELKAKLKGSSRLNKIRDAINKINQGYDKLAEIQAKKDKMPSLKQFDTIEVEVPCSPVKAPFRMDSSVVSSPSKLREAVFKSPAKAPPTQGNRLPYVSPRKLLEEMRPRDSNFTSPVKSPVYERYSSIAVQAGKPCLPLPYSYRLLGEIFRSIEVVVSMMFNRKEMVFFSKLKKSTQELSKKTLSEHHLGQILRVFPNAFRLTYERVKVFGKPDKYELTVHPVLPNNVNNNSSDQMVPSTVLERQRHFYKKLLDLAKTHHETYLLSLDPPLVVDKDKLTRWHPGFDLDSCPDIESVQLPKPPPLETFSSAKQLLGKAKEMFIVNPRMEKALEKLSHSENRNNPDGKPTAASAIPGLTNALKGLPKSLLEKVRAKQAAKAVEMLTRDPEKAKQDIEMSRLPEMARILRNLYVSERKNVMEKSHILDKLSSSFRENLSPNEMERHLLLLVDKTNGWLKTNKYGHVVYISMNKSMEMNNVFNSIKNAS